jgi:phenylpyruvate tautomerase PptA (4-oxalocrotonate tautomerase family)
MPLVTITVWKPKPAHFTSTVLDCVHDSLVKVGVPAADRFQRILEPEPEAFRFDTQYPEVQGSRDEDFVLVEALWSVGRSVKVKKQLLAALMQGLAGKGFEPENVMVVFKETNRENWSFAGGRQIHI